MKFPNIEPLTQNHDLILGVLLKIESDIAKVSAIPEELLDSGKSKTAIEVEMRIKASRTWLGGDR